MAEILSSTRVGDNLVHRFFCNDLRLGTAADEKIDGVLVSNGTSGVLAQGPSSTLASGAYRVLLQGAMRAYGAEGAHVYAFAHNGALLLGKSALGKADENGLIGTFDFVLNEACENFEFQVVVSDGCKVTLSRVDVKRMERPAPTAQTSVDGRTYPAWVILTGTIQDEQFVLGRLKFFADLKRDGHIEQLVFSTWRGEAARCESVANALNQYEFIVVESDEPDVVCHGHYLHQMVSVENALAVCPEHSFVFKARTDKIEEAPAFYENEIERLFKERKYVRPCDDELGVMQFKIGISGVYFTEKSIHLPVLFFWNDTNYFGFKPDIQKFLNHNVLSFEFQKLVPEQALFYSHFVHWWPCLEFYFQAINQWETIVNFIFHPERYRVALDTLSQVLVANPVFRRGFLAERYIVHRYFFDIVTGFDIELNTKFRGIELRGAEEFASVVSPKDNPYVRDPHLSVQVNALVDFLEHEFNITPVRRKVTSKRGQLAYTFTTPESKLQVKSALLELGELRGKLSEAEDRVTRQLVDCRALDERTLKREAELTAIALNAQQQTTTALGEVGLREREVSQQLVALQRSNEEERLEQARAYRQHERMLLEDFSAREHFFREQLFIARSELQVADKTRLEWQEKYVSSKRDEHSELQAQISQAARRERELTGQLGELRRELSIELDRRTDEWRGREEMLRNEFARKEEALAANLELRQTEFNSLIQEQTERERTLNHRVTDLAALELKLRDEIRDERQTISSLSASLVETEQALNLARYGMDQAAQRERGLIHQLGDLRREFDTELDRRTGEWHERELGLNDRVVALAQIESRLRDEIYDEREVILSLRHSVVEVEQALLVMRSGLIWRIGAMLRKMSGRLDPHAHLLSSNLDVSREAALPDCEGKSYSEVPRDAKANAVITESPLCDSVESQPDWLQREFNKLNVQIKGSDTSMNHAIPVSSVDDLIELNDQVFVEQAYQSILRRAPDVEGRKYYLHRLRVGVSKASILAQMRRSAEGKALHVQLEGLEATVRRETRARLPLIGWIFRYLDGTDSNKPAMRRMRAIENQISALDVRMEHRFERMDQTLVTLQQLIAQSVQTGAISGGGARIGVLRAGNGTDTALHTTDDEASQSGAGVFELTPRAREIYFALKTVSATTTR